METKKCSTCGIEKCLDEFHKWKYGPDGFRRVCKECRKIETSKYHYKYRERNLLKAKQYRENNKEKIKLSKQKLYERDKEKILLSNKIYRENNKEKRNEYSRNRKKTDPIFKLKHLMNSRFRIFLKSKNITKKNKTFDVVGCTPEELKVYLEGLFTEGMSWDKIGKNIHIDHIIPLSTANSEDEIYKLCHYTNLQPLWALDNMKKGSKLPS